MNGVEMLDRDVAGGGSAEGILDRVPLTPKELIASMARRKLTLSDVLADDRAVHVFRHHVAEHLALDWPQRANGLRSCGESGCVLFCAECDRAHVVPYRCNARSCPTCANIASAVVVEKLAKRAETALTAHRIDREWDGPGKRRVKSWKLLTGTQQTAGATGDGSRFRPRELRRAIMRVRKSWGPFWRSISWGKPVRVSGAETSSGKPTRRARRDTVFAMGIEVAPGGMTHLHAAIYGEYVPDVDVRELWEKQLGRDGFVKLNRMASADAAEFRKSLHEVLKYVSKGERSDRQPVRAASIELALRGVRRVEMGGAIRRLTLSPVDLITSTAPPCVECGTSGGAWRWGGMKAPAYVVANGGFGIDKWSDIRESDTGSMRGALYTAYFGGSAPPWMTDEPDELPSVEMAYQ